MINSYIRIDRWSFSGTCDMIVWGNGKDEWCKNLVEFTSYISATKDPTEVSRLKQMFCDNVSRDLNKSFTIEDLDKLVTKKDYRMGASALTEFTHIVDTNIKCFEQGKEQKYGATSIAGSALVKKLMERKLNDNE